MIFGLDLPPHPDGDRGRKLVPVCGDRDRRSKNHSGLVRVQPVPLRGQGLH